MAAKRALKWWACEGCGEPTRPAGLCSQCREQGASGGGRLRLAAAAASDPESAGGPVKRRRPIESGWCMSGRHGRCSHLLQTATDKRPEIHCACRCHRLVRNLAWRDAR